MGNKQCSSLNYPGPWFSRYFIYFDKMTTSFVDFNGKLQLAMGEDIIETDEE